MRALAQRSDGRGWAAWNIEYRRLGNGGGGRPRSPTCAARSITWRRSTRRSTSARVSDRRPLRRRSSRAVGRRARAAARRGAWSAGGPAPVALRAVISLAGVCDLAGAYRRWHGGARAGASWAARPSELPERYDAGRSDGAPPAVDAGAAGPRRARRRPSRSSSAATTRAAALAAGARSSWSRSRARRGRPPSVHRSARRRLGGGHASASRPGRPRGRALARSGAVGARELHEQAHAVARRALGRVGAPQVPGRAGDVQVRPGRVADEVREERPADDRAGLARFGRVVEVAVGALDELVVLLVQRQPPDDLAGAARRPR